MSLEAKLEQHKIVRANGVSYVIRKLTPALFLDRDYMLPISHIMEIKDPKKKEREIAETLDTMKDKVRDIILKGTVQVRAWLTRKRPDQVIDSIMGNPTLYTFLMAAIINHTLSEKKNPLSSRA